MKKLVSGLQVGAYRVDGEALQQACRDVPQGEYHVDRQALQQARQGVPRGEYHPGGNDRQRVCPTMLPGAGDPSEAGLPEVWWQVPPGVLAGL